MTNGVGFAGKEVKQVITRLSDADWANFVNKITDQSKRNLLEKYRSILKTCGLVSGSINLCSVPSEIAELILKNNGDPSKTIRYSQSNGLRWLEEGIKGSSNPADDFGWLHIKDRHFYNSSANASKFPNISEDTIKNIIFDTLENSPPVASRGNLKYEKLITFPSGQNETVRVITYKSGKIITAHPLKTVN